VSGGVFDSFARGDRLLVRTSETQSPLFPRTGLAI